MVQPENSKIVILGTGGTIAGTAARADDNIGYTAATVGVEQLLSTIETLPALLRGRMLVTEQVAQIDSKDMSFKVWQRLAERCAHWLGDPAVQGIVMTHGTDTLEETAYFLQSVLQPQKPVVLTCAMRPSTALAPDGPQNLVDAVTVSVDAATRGVVAVCAGAVHSARDVRKNHPYRVDAFDSGDAGPLGYIEENSVRWLRHELLPAVPDGAMAMETLAATAQPPRVEIIMSHAGADGAIVDLLVKDGVRGLVVAGTGNGSVHQDLEAALLRAKATGVRVVRATRCNLGRVLPRPGDVLADSGGLSPAKARVALMLELLASGSC